MASLKCIYCKQEIWHPTKEHIIPYALGGRYSSNDIVCRSCNEQLGHKVDSVLISWVPFVWARNLFSLKGQSGDIPCFEVEDTEGRAYIAEPGWRLRPKIDKPLRIIHEIITDRGVTRKIIIMAPDEDTALRKASQAKKAWLHHLRRQGHRVRESDVKTWLGEVKRNIIRPFGFKPQCADFGIQDEHYRAIAKIAFEYVATKLAREEIVAPEFDVIREFILCGTLKSDDYWKLFLADYRDIYTVWESQKPSPFFHRVTIYCNKDTKNVIGLVELFGRVRVAIVLSWQYEGRTMAHCLIEYPPMEAEARYEEHDLKQFDPILTEMIAQLSQEQFDKTKQDFQYHIQLLSEELEDYHTRSHMREVLNEYFAEPLLLAISDLSVLIPRLVSYYAYRSNLAALKRLMEKDATHFLQAIVQVQAEKTGTPVIYTSEYVELIRKAACLQILVELLTVRIHQLEK